MDHSYARVHENDALDNLQSMGNNIVNTSREIIADDISNALIEKPTTIRFIGTENHVKILQRTSKIPKENGKQFYKNNQIHVSVKKNQ